MSWTFHSGDIDQPDVRDLLALHFDAMRASSPPEACHVLPLNALKHPDISFWTVRERGRLLGIGALKELGGAHGEVKSMRTASDAVGRGVGTAMLHHIIGEAILRGYRRLSLETGSGEGFGAALHLYQRQGFVPCDPFGDYRPTPFTRFFTLAL